MSTLIIHRISRIFSIYAQCKNQKIKNIFRYNINIISKINVKNNISINAGYRNLLDYPVYLGGAV